MADEQQSIAVDKEQQSIPVDKEQQSVTEQQSMTDDTEQYVIVLKSESNTLGARITQVAGERRELIERLLQKTKEMNMLTKKKAEVDGNLKGIEEAKEYVRSVIKGKKVQEEIVEKFDDDTEPGLENVINELVALGGGLWEKKTALNALITSNDVSTAAEVLFSAHVSDPVDVPEGEGACDAEKGNAKKGNAKRANRIDWSNEDMKQELKIAVEAANTKHNDL